VSCVSAMANESVMRSQTNVQTHGVIYNVVGYGLYFTQGQECVLFKKSRLAVGSLTASHVVDTGDEAAGS